MTLPNKLLTNQAAIIPPILAFLHKNEYGVSWVLTLMTHCVIFFMMHCVMSRQNSQIKVLPVKPKGTG
jgi:hypothetical protein